MSLPVFLSFILLAHQVFASATPTLKVADCHSNGGGYITQDLKVTKFGDEWVRFELQRFSPVPDLVPDTGLLIEGKLTKQATVLFPASACQTKRAPAPQLQLIACTTGISKLSADVTLLDGTQTALALPDNFTIEVQQESTYSVFESKTGDVVQARFSSITASGVGFRMRECK